MIADILTVTQKELREMLLQGDPRGRGRLSLVILVVLFGVIFPLQNGREWVTSPVSVVIWAWMPFLWVSGVVADSFAGERERHTLESLLATRLSDRSILFGKLLAALMYSCLLTWGILLISLVTVNIFFGQKGLLFFPLPLLTGAILFTILISGLSASIGVLISMRAGSVRQAQQLMSVVTLIPFILLMLIRFLPESVMDSLNKAALHVDPSRAALWIVLILLMLDSTLIAVGVRLFQRSKLILD